jgi:histone acetyltransferase MYST1
MDEWVPLDNFDLATIVPPEPPEPGERARGGGQARRRPGEEHSSSESGEGHEDFDPQQLREHEEFTKARRG